MVWIGALAIDQDNAMQSELVINANMDAAASWPVSCGTAVVYSRKSPQETEVNEDTAALVSISPTACVLAVADGAGGTRAGGRAARIAVEQLADALEKCADLDRLREAILSSFDDSNRAILDSGLGSGTTLAVALVQDGIARFFHVGDSMIILMGQRGKIRYQTTTHSPTGYAVESGMLDEDDAILHEDRHFVSNLVGSGDMAVEMGPAIRLRPFDTLLVASDGLFDNLLLSEIVECVRKGPALPAVGRLHSDCLRRMERPEPGEPSKPDDLTIVMFRPRRLREGRTAPESSESA